MTGMVVTFYSYKGGVGRSFALVNAATLLASWGYRVLCVDWDLEAPGLDAYLAPHLDGPPPEGGVVELFTAVAAGDDADPARYTVSVPLPGLRGGLDLLPAGGRTDQAGKVQRLDWAGMYRDQDLGATLEKWRARWMADYHFVLIDSRTGITDIGGICTAQLPDILVAMCTANEQSVRGIVEVAERAAQARDGLPYDRPRLQVLPVPSRFDARDEYEAAAAWQRRFAEALGPLFVPWLAKSASVETVLGHVTVPYVSYWSFGEQIAALTEREPTPNDITYSLQALAALLAHRLDRTDLLAASRDAYVATAERAGMREHDGVESRHDVFLLAAEGDRKMAELIEEALDARGMRVLSLTGEPDRPAVLQEALATARHLMVIVGRRTPGSVTKFVDTFARQTLDEGSGRTVLVVLAPGVKESELPPPMRRLDRYEVRLSTEQAAAAEAVALDMDYRVTRDLWERWTMAAAEGGAAALFAGLETAVKLGRLAYGLNNLPEADRIYLSAYLTLPCLPEALMQSRAGRAIQAELFAGMAATAEGRGRLATAVEFYQGAARSRAVVAEGAPADPEAMLGAVEAWEAAARVATALSDSGTARETYSRALGALRRLLTTELDEGYLSVKFNALLGQAIGFHAARGELDEAVAIGEDAMRTYEELTERESAKPDHLFGLGGAFLTLGRLYLASGRTGESEDLLRRALANIRMLADHYPDVAALVPTLGHVRMSLGLLLLGKGNSDEALLQYRSASAAFLRWRELEPTEIDASVKYAQVQHEIGDLFQRNGDLNAATAEYQRALRALKEAGSAAASDPAFLRGLRETHRRLAENAERMGDLAMAATEYREVAPIDAKLAAADPDDAEAQRRLRDTQLSLGNVARASGDQNTARRSYRSALLAADRLNDRESARVIRRMLADLDG